MPETKRYARLRALLQEKITSGSYQQGDRFFSQNELMRKYGLSFSTVIRALDELVADGFLVRRQGKGTFVAKTSFDQKKAEIEEKHITIFAPWENSPGAAFGAMNAAEFYRHLNEARPDWMHLRLVPIRRDAEDLERWLFSKDKTDAAIAFYPDAAQCEILSQMAHHHPVVTITAEKPLNGISSVLTSFSDAMVLAVRHLIDQGHTAIALVLPAVPTAAAEFCIKGYRSSLRDAAYPYNEQLLIRCEPSDPTGYHATIQLFDLNSSVQITSVIAVGCALLPGVLYAADAMRLSSRNELEVVCVDDQQCHGDLTGRVAKVIFPIHTTARAVVSLLEQALISSETGTIEVTPEYIPVTRLQDS